MHLDGGAQGDGPPWRTPKGRAPSPRAGWYRALVGRRQAARQTPDAAERYRAERYEWMEPSLTGSLMMMSPFRILTLYRQFGLVQTQALYSIDAP